MNPDTPQIDDLLLWLGAIAGALLIITAAMFGTARFFRSMMRKIVEEQVKPISAQVLDIQKELRTNGGSSLRDAINRIDYATKSSAAEISETRKQLQEHIVFHLSEGK